jgi:hypothetical protein
VVFSESGVKKQSIIPGSHMSRTIELVLDLNHPSAKVLAYSVWNLHSELWIIVQNTADAITLLHSSVAQFQ